MYFSRHRKKRMDSLTRLAQAAKTGRISVAEFNKLSALATNPARVTPAVRRISRRNFSLKGKPDRAFVQSVLDWMYKNIRYTGENQSTAMKLYGNLVAEDILGKRRIPTMIGPDNRPLFGCGMVCDGFIALLKTFPGIEEIKHVRVGIPIVWPKSGEVGLVPHSIVVFTLPGPKGKKIPFVADPFDGGKLFLGRNALVPLSGEIKKKVGILKKLDLWAEGESLRDFNRDFSDYASELRKIRERSKKDQELIKKSFGV